MSSENPKSETVKTLKTFYSVWVKEAFGVIRDYFDVLKKVTSEVKITAAEIEQNKINVKLVVRAIIGGLIIAGAIDLFSGIFFSAPDEGSSDILTTFLFMIFIFIGAIIVHPVLKWQGGKASLIQTFYANAIVSAASPPVTSMAIFMSNLFGMTDYHAGYISTAMLIPILAHVHKISQIRVGFVLIFTPIAIIILGMILILPFV